MDMRECLVNLSQNFKFVWNNIKDRKKEKDIIMLYRIKIVDNNGYVLKEGYMQSDDTECAQSIIQDLAHINFLEEYKQMDLYSSSGAYVNKYFLSVEIVNDFKRKLN